MIIEESDFRLIPIDESSPKFDLELLYTVRPNGKEVRKEFKNVAYGRCLDHAIKKIAQYRVACKHENEVINLLTYFKEFTEELNSLKALCGI